LPDRSIDTDPPTLDEVRRAIEKLKNGRAAGGDGITPELLKCAPVPIANALHALFCKVWETGRVPVSWRDGIIVPLYKGKGPKAECSNYRPISLLSVPGKVFAHVLLNRLNPLLVQSHRPEQSGFTAGRSTADAILTLRLLAELHLEFKRPLHVAYVDLKSAFDSVDRAALWSALKGIGTPDILLRLLQDLHANTGA
jgi:Reverse transcriptase (RNA-dependent DNA polymerase)